MALSASGDFVVAWQSEGQDGDTGGVFARRFDAAGVVQAAEFRVNTNTAGKQGAPAVALSASGDFVIAWASDGQDGDSYGIFARRFDAAGVAQAAELRINNVTSGSQSSPSVARDSEGGFVVAWSSNGQDGDSFGVFARRFSSAGVAQAVELQVNAYTTNSQISPFVALDAQGDFVVTWTSSGQDGNSAGVFARRFDAAGVALTSELQVNTYTNLTQVAHSVALDTGGDFVVAWSSFGQDGNSTGVLARRFDAAGVARGGELVVNTYTASVQDAPSVASDASGNFVVTWQSFGQDGSSYGIFAQRLGTPAVLDLDGNGATDALTDGLLILRYLFGFRGPILTAGAVGGGCTRCDALAIEAYLPTILPAKETIRVGGELQVNTFTTSDQSAPSVALDVDGEFVVTWRSDDQDGSGNGVFAQRFAADGTSLGDELQVNSFTANDQVPHGVAVEPDGDFVVVWSSRNQDGGYQGVFGQRFVSSGARFGAEFQVGLATAGNQVQPVAASDADGNLVVVWSSQGLDGAGYGVVGRRFSSAGDVLGAEFLVNQITFFDQLSPAISLSSDGDFVVAWYDYYLTDVFARRFDSSGVALGDELQVNAYTSNLQDRPRIVVEGDGDFVVAWDSVGQDGSARGVFARRFASAGAALGAELQINSYTTGAQSHSGLGLTGDGGFVVVWQTAEDGSGDGVTGRRFDSLGVSVGAEFAINSYTPGDQTQPVIATGANRMVVAWTSAAQDGSGNGVFAQPLGAIAVLDVDGNGAVEALSDGLLLLRYLFGFRGPTLVTGAVDLAGCQRCDAVEVEAYLATLL